METIRNYILPLGLKKAAFTLAAAFVFTLLDLELFAFFSFLLTLFFFFAYRNPSRISADISDYGVCAPIDGKIVAIEDINEGEYGFKLVIDSSFLQTGLLRSPFEAKRASFSLQRGSRLAKDSHLFSSLNERLEVLFESGEKRVKVCHTLKRSPLRIELFDHKSQLECCEIYGFAYDALSVVYLPREFRLNVHVGQRVYASQNILGYFSS